MHASHPQAKLYTSLKVIMQGQVTFKIARLGAIRDSSMTLAPMMLFSGESGLGKSYAAFLVHYLYTVLVAGGRILSFLSEQKYSLPENPPSEVSEDDTPILSIPVRELMSWLNRDAVSYIGYLVGNPDLDGEVEIDLPLDPESSLDFNFFTEIKGLESQKQVFYKVSLGSLSYSVISNEYKPSAEPYGALIIAYLRDLIFGSVDRLNHSFLFPPSRGSLMEMGERPNFRSGMYEEFFDLKALLNSPQKEQPQVSKSLEDCVHKVNKGFVRREESQYVYELSDGQKIPLTAAASSIKELAPLTLLLNRFPVKGLSILFEEPEAHVHPNRQVKLADLLACIVKEGAHLQVTTHSDYLIKRLNNLMRLSLLQGKMPEEDFAKLLSEYGIEPEYLLSAEDVRAFLLREREDGSSEIVEQDLSEEHSIPFESFYQVIREDMDLTHRIDDELDRRSAE